MSVPADQLQQGQPQVFTEQDFATAENPPPGAPVPGAFSDSAFGPDPNEPAALPQQSFLDRAGSAIKSGYHDIVGDKTDKAGTPKSEAKPGKITAKDIALNAAEDYYKYMPGLNTAYRAARLGAEVGANPKPFLRALVPQAELTFDKVMRNLASADNAFGSEPVWVDANGKPVGAVTTADVERNAKATLEHQQKVVSALAKLHPAATQAAGAIPEGGLNLLLALGGGAELKSVEEASARYPEVVQAFKNPVVRAFAKRAYELLKEAPRGMKTMFLPSAYEATNTYHEIKDNGGSVGQAVEGSFAIGASSDLLGSLPVGMRGPWVRRMLMGVFYGPLSGVVQTEATNPFLPKELQQKNTAVGLGINSAFNGVMATVFGIRDPSPERVNEIFDNVENTAQNDPDPEARASAQRILNHANQMALASGGRSEPAMLGASHGEQARKQVVDAPHEQLYGQHPAYTAAYDAAKGQIQDEAQRQQYAKGIAAADTALNASWQHFFKLRKVIDDGVKDYQAAGQMPDLLAHAAKVLRPETFNDLQDFLSPPGKVDPNSPQPGWMQQGMSPQYARDIVLRTLESGQLPPEFKQSMDALAQRRAAFMKANPNIDPDTGEPITPVEGTPKPQEPSKPAPQGKPPDESPKPPPTAGAAQPKPALHPLQTLAAWLDATKYPRAQNVMRYAVALPQNLQQPMVDWAVNQSPMEAESAFADAANKGVLPEGVTNETEGSTQPAETAAEQDQAGVRATEAKAQPEAEKGGHAEGRVAAGNEGSPVRQNEHAGNGNAAPAEGHAEAPVAVKQAQADLTDAQNDLNEKLQNGVVGSELDKAHDAVETARVNLHVAQGASVRSAPVQSALEDAGVAPEEATVAPNGDVRISPDASPEAAQKAVDVAAADTGATNTEYPEPTPEQAKAGNYRKGGITFPSNDGNIRVKIENPDGSVRSGDWGSRPLKGVHYGYFPDTVSADGQPLDVLLTHNAHDPTRPIAFIRQHDTTTGKFDELKAVMGTRSRNEALQAYWKQYPRDLHLKLTPNGSQDVVMMNRAKAVAFLKSGHVDVPPHPVSGRPMLKLQQTVPVEFDIRAGNISGVRDILDKLGRKHDLSGLTEEAGIYTGKIPRSAVPDLRRALEKNRVELETKQAPARQPRVAGRVRENARASGAGAHPEPRAVGGRSAQKVPAKRSPPPEGLGFVRSSAPVFEEGVSGHIGAHPVSVVGVHYSPKEGLTELDPAEAGTGSAGAERRRYGMGNFGRSGDPMARVMSFYVKDSAAIPAKESAVSGSNRYEAVLNNLYDVKADPDGIIAHAHAEGYGANTDRILEDIRSHGYDGFVSAEPQAGQHARVATVVGVDGKIPVKPVQTLAERYQEPGVHRVAERVARVRDKFEEAAKQTKDELKKRTKRPMFLLRQENADEKNLAHLYFEYAPSPDFKVKDAVFNRLTLATRKAIHDEMAKYIGPDRLPEYVFGKHNPVVTGYGGYLGRINPSARVDYDSGISNKDLLQHAQDIADAYNQQSVLVVSDKLPKKAPALDILFDGANDPAKLEKFWTALRDKTDGEAVGFSQIDGGITILNLDAKPEDAGAWFAKLKSAVSEISDQDGVKYEGHETQVGFDFVGGNYDRYLASLQGRNLSPREKAVDSLQIESYDTLASGISWGQRFDERAAKGLVAAGNAGVHARSERYRAVARLTRDKPSLADVRAAKDSVAQTEKRYAGDLKAFDEGGVALPSPKGGPSKLSRSQWVAVRTPEFLRWGGDWLHDPKNADVLLDKATGEPQVFYHETAAVNEAPIMLQGFRTDLPTSRHNDYRVPTGVFLKAKAGDIGVGYTGVRRQLPMFLRMRKPLVVDDKDQLLERLGGEAGKAEAEVDARIKEVTKLVNEYAAIAKENPDNPLMARAVKQFVERTEESFEGASLRAQEVIRKEMQAQGYDGVILKKDQGRHETIQTYIALDSKDIKSADFNVGTFSERAAPMFKLGDTFYSALTRAVENARGAPKAAPGSKWKEWLDGAQRRGEFHGNERQWSGIDQWLDDHQGLVTRQALLDQVRANEVQINQLATGAYEKYVLPGGEDYQELLLQHANASGEPYTSPHFGGVKNLLAHIRTTRRVDENGAKVLNVEEVQSDLHQAGRERGYATPETAAKIAESRKKIDELRAKFEQLRRGPDRESPEIDKARADLAAEHKKFAELSSGVKNAPLKSEWPLLGIKAAIRHAAENGYGKVTWTTGDQQAERYRLDSYVDKIETNPLPDDARTVRITVNRNSRPDVLHVDSDGIITQASLMPERLQGHRLESVVGRGLAKRIMGSEEKLSISGDGLRVGGHGMRTFYDEILPKAVAKYVKQWGGKVGESKISTRTIGDYKYRGPEYTVDALNEVRAKYRTIADDDSKSENERYDATIVADQLTNAIDDMVENATPFDVAATRHISQFAAKKLGGKVSTEEPTFVTVHSVDITPAMRESVMEGQPLFRRPFGAADTPQRVADVKASVERLVGQFGTKPNVVVHASRAEATPEVKAALDDVLGDSGGSPAAMYLDGTLHVFSDANRTPAELESAVMHEMVHFGLRKVFGEDMNPLLDDIWKNVQNDRSFADTLDAYRDAYKDRPNPEFQRNIAEEYVAHLAETQSKPGVWRKVVDWFRAWGRQHGLVHDWTDDDIRNLIRSVYSDLREGRTSIAGLPAARTTVDFAEGLQRTTYRGAAHGDFIHDMNGDWSFQNPDVHAELYRSLVDGEPSLNADPVGDSKITVQGVKDLAALAGEEHANLTLPDSVPAATVKGAGVPFATYDGMHVLRPEHTSSPMFALRNRGTADPDVQAVIDQKIGYDREPTSPWEWIQAPLRAFHFRQMANDAKAYAIDAGAYIDLLERKLNKGDLFDAVTSAYKQYWLTRNIRQIAMAVLRRGVPMATTKGYEFRPGTEGLLDIWKPMLQTVDGKNNMELYGAYKIGVRAKRLLHEFNPDGTPKEKLLTEDEADKFIALGEKHPEFKEAFAKEQKFINELLDFAVERGALDPKTAEVWKRNAYVPFRRIIDGVEKPSDFEVRGVNDKIKSKAIRGAEYALKDPNQALVNNVIRMLDHVYNNDAKRRVMALGELSGAVKKLPLKFAPTSMSVKDAMNAMRKAGIEVDRADLTPEDLSKIMTVFKPVAPFGRNIESTVEKGRLVWWEVNDPRLLRSIHDMRAINSAMTDKVIKYVGAPARWVRLGVTMSPKFMAKIMFKDMVNTFGQTGTNPNMLKHIWTNTRRILSDDKFIDQLRLNGFNGNEYYKVDEIAQAMERLHGNGSFTVLNGVKKAYRAYRRVGWVSEQLSRTRVAEHTLDRGGSLAEAAWQGQNTLNWQKHGYGTAAKLLMRTVPFLNAHLQGMTRIYDGMLGRDVIEHRGRAIMSFFIKSMALAIPSMVLEAENQNNKDYQRLPDYMKDAYWNIYIAGHHYVLPKPFEWGAMAATMPQRALRVATGQDSSREFWKAVGDTLTNDVVMLPIPAAFQEPIEQWGNKDLRTGLPIESEALQNREPAQRYNPSTTLAARVIGGDIGVAPVRVQHAVNGYFSSVGMFMLQMMSGVMRATGNYPAAPERRGGSWIKEALEQPFGGAPAATEPGNQYLSDFYQAQAIADQVSGSAHAVATSGDYGRAQQLVEGNPLAFRGHHELQVISVQLSQLRKQERIVEASPFLSPQQKRAQLNDINEAQKQLLDRYEPLFRAILDGKKEIETEQ